MVSRETFDFSQLVSRDIAELSGSRGPCEIPKDLQQGQKVEDVEARPVASDQRESTGGTTATGALRILETSQLGQGPGQSLR